METQDEIPESKSLPESNREDLSDDVEDGTFVVLSAPPDDDFIAASVLPKRHTDIVFTPSRILDPVGVLAGIKDVLCNHVPPESNVENVKELLDQVAFTRACIEDLKAHPARAIFPPLDIDVEMADSSFRGFQSELARDYMLLIESEPVDSKALELVQTLYEILDQSVWTHSETHKWLKKKLLEFEVLYAYVVRCKGFDAFTLHALDILGQPECPSVICLRLRSSQLHDPHLKTLQGSHDPTLSWWFTEETRMIQINESFAELAKFMEANKNNTGLKFGLEFDSSPSAVQELVTTFYYRNQISKEVTLPSEPQNVEVVKRTDQPLLSKQQVLKWEPPRRGDEHVTAYIVKYRPLTGTSNADATHQSWSQFLSKTCYFTLEKLKPGVSYEFLVSCITEFGMSPSSRAIKQCYSTKEKVKKASIVIGKTVDMTILKPKMEVKGHNSQLRVSRIFAGTTKFAKKNRNIMLLGQTGAGKSTVINSIANYFYGVQADDKFRFKIVQEIGETSAQRRTKSMTGGITIYILTRKVNGEKESLSLIDTPGFADTEGFARDQLITESITNFLMNPDPELGNLDTLDAVGLVVKGSDGKLNPSQEYIFGRVFLLFGKDLVDNMFWLVNFTEAKRPPVIDAIETGNFPTRAFFKLNNSCLYESLSDDPLGSIMWKLNYDGLRGFLHAVDETESKSLTTTGEVLRARKELETIVLGLKPQVKRGLDKINEHRELGEKLAKHKQELLANSKYVIDLEQTEIKLMDTDTELKYLSCPNCKTNCHENCKEFMVRPGWGKYWCSAIGWRGSCRICPKRCWSNTHAFESKRYSDVIVTCKVTLEDIRQKYQLAKESHDGIRDLTEKIDAEIEECQVAVFGLIKRAHEKIQQLNDIAMKPHPGSLHSYLEELIENEKVEATPGWEKRVRELEESKGNSLALEKMWTEINKTGKAKLRQTVNWLEKIGSWLPYISPRGTPTKSEQVLALAGPPDTGFSKF